MSSSIIQATQVPISVNKKFLNANDAYRFLIKEKDIQSLIKQKFYKDKTETGIEAIEESYKITLICPLTRKRLIEPARGVNCKHIEAFELTAFVECGFKTQRWTCPICKLQTPLISIKLDVFLDRILNSCKFDQVEILEDLNWKQLEKCINSKKWLEDSDGCIDLTENELNDTIFIKDTDFPEYDKEIITLE